MKLYKSCLLTAALLLSSLEDAYTTDQPREQKSDNVLTVQNSKVRFPTDEERFVLPNIFSPIKALVDPKQGLQKKVASLQKAIERKEKVVSSLNDQITINRIERTRTIDIINVYQLRMKKKPSAVAEEFIKQNLDKLEEKLSDIDEKLKSLKNQLDGHEEDIEYQTLELGHLEKLKNQDLDLQK
ncbi:uncharacterized protein PHALS_02576 [Plasmopara halstedii]|uniref:RxLR-like protein n=1 Tax=Plasmopara halstedii TaxID=4781 RepID=A0A0P1AY25_PLAHL|nr:uncharacterized protein PHALS_02576 [Plasmopara halstedii]CEG46157.1 hypothetical protein PHALS_02576 [Plasmopara halstedii]|eukprot:XP_024582526.1 hypothetical protein PHALS_02576 [Plasmopara halstedii]